MLLTMQKDLNDKVSVIIPAYNAEKYISETLDSLLAQDYTNWEALIVEDCSSDNTLNLINHYASNDSRIKVFQNSSNVGAALTRNKGIEEASGRYLAFLDSDDLWSSDKLTKQLAFMKDNNYPFTCTAYGKIDETSKKYNHIVKVKKRIQYKQVFTNVPGNLTVIYDTNYIEKTFIPDIRKRNDLLMWARVIKKAKYLYGLNEVLAYHRVRSGSISSNKRNLIKYNWQVYYKHENLSLVRSIYILTIVILKSFINSISLKLKTNKD